MGSKIKITLGELKKNVRVVPETGKIYWIRTKGQVKAGDEAGFVKCGGLSNGGGYRIVCINNLRLRAHHVVWFWVTGEWPVGEIDHKNGMRDENRFDNLRDVAVEQNRTNRTIQSNNKAGYKWVYWDTQRNTWRAEIAAPKSMEIGRKRLHQSFHSTAEEAYQAASDAARHIHGSFFNAG